MSAAPLPLLLRAMRLPTIAREYDQAVQRAEAENWGYPVSSPTCSRPRPMIGSNARSSAS